MQGNFHAIWNTASYPVAAVFQLKRRTKSRRKVEQVKDRITCSSRISVQGATGLNWAKRHSELNVFKVYTGFVLTVHGFRLTNMKQVGKFYCGPSIIV